MKVVIVGGGTAGWIAAGYLIHTHNRLAPTVDVTLVESPKAGRIGVGEATFPTLRRTLQRFGIEENEFLRRTGSTFKHGVRFENWSRIGELYHHPFEALEPHPTSNDAEDWIIRRALGEARPFAYDYGVQAAIADAHLCPRIASDPDYQGLLNYAYHVDADELGDFLAERMIADGVDHIRGDVVESQLDPSNGQIASVLLADGRRIEGDFFVDCTGFSSILFEKTLGVPFVSYEDHLFADRAVAMRRAYRRPKEAIAPFTTARALSNGWMWKVALQQRSGQGYVYSSSFQDDESAQREFRKTIGADDDEDTRLLRFRVGRTAVSWERNCAAIGLSSGFIEPLESTGIYLIEEAASLLARLLPVDGPSPASKASFNRFMSDLYEEIRDFIVLHYCLTKREDSAFWREVVKPEHWPDRVKHYLDIWSRRAPSREDLNTRSAFMAESYQYVVFGLDWIGAEARRRAEAIDLLPPPPPARVDARKGELLRMLPSHKAYLEALASA